MQGGFDKLGGHAYAPGFEPGFLTMVFERMLGSDLAFLGIATLGCIALAAVLTPKRLFSPRARRDEAQPASARAHVVRPDDLADQLRTLRLSRQGLSPELSET